MLFCCISRRLVVVSFRYAQSSGQLSDDDKWLIIRSITNKRPLMRPS